MKFTKPFFLGLFLLGAGLVWSAEQSGDTLIGKNLRVRLGASSSNATVGGVVFLDATQYTNCCAAIATTTNLSQYTLPADALNAAGDSIAFRAYGSAASISNRVQVVFGSETILDTGNRVNGTAAEGWTAHGRITRISATSQHATATFMGLGTPSGTNVSLFLSQTCSVATVLKTMGGSSTNATLTNQLFIVEYLPSYNPQ